MKKISFFLCGLVAGIVFWDTIAQAQKDKLPVALRFDRVTPEVQVVRLSEPAVVSIQTNKLVGQDYYDMFGNWYRRQQSSRPFSQGSGVIIDPEGYLITNEHVIRDADQIKVRFNPKYDKNEYEAVVISRDSTGDLALLKISRETPFAAVPIGHSDDLMIGERVIAIGNPYGEQNSVTAGILSAIGRDVVIENRKVTNLIQTDASINPGNSGGPLLNINGELIGINNAIHPLAEGIGFAIPVDQVIEILNSRLLNPDESHRLWIGTQFQQGKEARIDHVDAESPAEKAGLRKGDLILAVQGKLVDSLSGFSKLILGYSAGDNLKLQILRDNAKENVTLKLGAYADKLILNRLGLMVELINLQNSNRLKVLQVSKDGPADRIGVQKGDLLGALSYRYKDILGMTRERTLELDSIDDLVQILDRVEQKTTLGIVIYREGDKYRGEIILR